MPDHENSITRRVAAAEPVGAERDPDRDLLGGRAPACAQDRALESAITSLRDEVQRLDAIRQLLELVAVDSPPEGHSELAGELEGLRHQLQTERRRNDALEAENAELASEIAEARLASPARSQAMAMPAEAMSWDQRKAAMLERLQREDDEGLYDGSEKDSLRDMIARSDQEIRRRDQEITELRALLERQSATLASSTTVGEPVAVGAAAFAHLFDADELVREEREKLKAIQTQWEEKLRQSEIEMSLERAKLARSRREIEQKQADLEEQLFRLAKTPAEADEGITDDKAPRRRWLRQLGLGEGG